MAERCTLFVRKFATPVVSFTQVFLFPSLVVASSFSRTGHAGLFGPPLVIEILSSVCLKALRK